MAHPLARREPVMGMIGPEWYHHHGSKMAVDKRESAGKRLVISGSAAWLRIIPGLGRVTNSTLWFVEYEIEHSLHSRSSGRLVFSTQELKSAFGLADSSGRGFDWLLGRFGGDVAAQGLYIRWHDFLNIPGPGTGHDGDSNISIHLDDEIRQEVRKLVAE